MDNQKVSGVIYAAAAYALWGILPIYWKLINVVAPMEILAHRIVWAFGFVMFIIAVTRQWKGLKTVFEDRRQVLYAFIAAVLVTSNWGLYIWAVNSNRILDSSLGYYINPLVTVLLGVIFFKEKLDYWKGIALVIASAGVIILTVQYGKIPWVSLGLALSFGLYGAMKKLVKASSIIGLTVETAIVTPFALLFITIRQTTGQGAFGRESIAVMMLLIGAGAVTAIPLLLFAQGAKKVPMSTLGFTQYISPTLSLLLGVFLYHEVFTPVKMVSFCFIWLALVVYSIPQLRGITSKGHNSSKPSEMKKIEDAV